MKNIRSFISIFLILLPLWAQAQREVKCRVVRVSDGDSLTCLAHNNKQIKVRLLDIDAPERRQPFGNKARQQLAQLIFKREITLRISGYDRYNRTLATVFNEKNENINLKMVQLGLAWAYNQYSENPEYGKAEALAKKRKIGLWRETNPIEPSRYRRELYKRNIQNKKQRTEKN
ncbi:thermonuclease family protein [Basfia succiniciproducens]|uniref:Endonuclease YncB, thermonuclease family n=1 Tax=Basfia succiniciproducens TaxID=653940 RepID=A0A1G5AGK5_9PAST|nr:thermonuclease family protein [Basfia succiniciproducens]QIM68608.1 hypothetical protein A4G13_03985 [Basfia succiniciproducens]SCX77013.1 Endonuclease YncB, thermonuclease family [Basfia succiniciproducens]